MRQAYTDVTVIGDPEIGVIGVSLGFDHCAEHEFGIKGIRYAMGINTGAAPGIDRRRMGLVASSLLIKEFKATATEPAETRIAFNLKDYDEEFFQKRKHSLCTSYKGKLSAAWDDRSFMVRAFSCEERQVLRDVHQAFGAGDLSLGIGKSKPFGNAPLILVIVSRLPQSVLDEIRLSDEDDDALQAASAATGIADLLKSAGKGYFALSPSWARKFTTIETVYPVVYWLNPSQQHVNAHGWFSVETLTQWAEGKGPVIKANRSTEGENGLGR